MVDCRKGKKEEYEDIIDFANYVFSQNQCPHDFKSLLPKLYADGKNYAEYHYLITEDGKIKALVCAMPLEYLAPEEVIKTGCIGMVSVHPYARGKGYMKKLMHYVIEDMQAMGCAYIFLGGQRQRYEYFGFEPAGVQLEFTVTSINVRHNMKNTKQSNLQLVPLVEEVLLNKAYTMYEAQPFRMRRDRQDFSDVLCSWKSSPYAILQNGNLAGYFVLRSDGTVTELIINDASIYQDMLEALFSLTGKDSHTFLASPAETDKVCFLLQIAETWSIITCENYLIFNWVAVFDALLNRKAGYDILQGGSVKVRIDDIIVEITVKDNIPEVHEVTEDADFTLTALEATSLLLSTAGEFRLKECTAKLSEQKRACIRGWFPLPLWSPLNDCC
jgi:predicted acetyltransferase